MNLHVIRANLVVSVKSFYREKTVVFFRIAFPVILNLPFRASVVTNCADAFV